MNVSGKESCSIIHIMKAFENKQIIEVKYQAKQSLIQRIGLQVEASVENLFAKFANRRADVM